MSLSRVVVSALLAGVVAGLAAATFHFLATESVIDHAIMLETLHRQAEGTYEEPMVSREVQKVGLFVGFLIYGLTWSLLFGAVFHATQRWLPGRTLLQRGAFLAGTAFSSAALLPFLKYPANPPGIGDPDTITLRQTLYLSILALSVLGTAFAVALARFRGWPTAAAFLAVFAIAVYVLLPGNPDAVRLPTDVLWTFRALSIAGLAVFWTALGLTFGLLLQRQDARVALRPQPSAV